MPRSFFVCVAVALCLTVGAGPSHARRREQAETVHVECRAASRFALDHPQPQLQNALERELRRRGLWAQVERSRLAVSVVDLSHPGAMYYAGVNDDVMMYAASLPKIAILLAVAQSVQRGALGWTPELARRLTAMITESSNSDAAWATDLVGLQGIADAVQSPKWCFYDAERGGGLWMGRAYRKASEALRDPLKNLSHAATARQTARFYAMLSEQALVSRFLSRRMLDVMGPPRHHHKFVGGIGNRRGVDFLARKSGTWTDAHSDSALIQHFGQRYVLVGISETNHGEAIMRQVAQLVDDIIMTGEHRSVL